MGSIRQPENIGKLTKTSSTTVQLPASRLNIGGQQYVLTSPISLSISVVGAGGLDATAAALTVYYVFAVLANGAPALIASASTAPSGYSQYRLVGHFFADTASTIYQVWAAGEYDQETSTPKYRSNLILNSNFDIAQRGITFNSVAHAAYTLDRWWVATDSIGTVNVTRQSAVGSIAGSTYCIRAERSAGTNRWVIGTNLETIDTRRLIGKVATLSLYLRKGSALTANINILFSTRSQEAKFGSVLDSNTINVPASSLNTSTFTRVSIPLALSNTSALGLAVEISATQAGAAGAYFEVAQVMLNEGPVAAPYQPAGATIEEELELCQRFYETGVAGWEGYGLAGAFQSIAFPFKVTKRTGAPSMAGSTTLGSSGVNAAITSISAINNYSGWVKYNKDGTTGNFYYQCGWIADDEL